MKPQKIVHRLMIIIVTGLFISQVPIHGFGKNKISYRTFEWKKHVSDHFEFYYYPEEQMLIPAVIGYFESAYARISHDLGTDLSGRTPVILYKTHREFEQTNVISDFIPQGVGGFSEPIKRRIVIPLEGSKHDLESLIIHELVHSFQFEILFQNRLNRISPVPLWIMEGLAEHIAEDWDAIGRMVLRDAVINHLLPPLSRMNDFNSMYSSYLGYKAAQSAIDYIRMEYGVDKLRDLYWEMRKTLRSSKYFQNAVKETLGISLEQLSDEWQEDLRRRIIELERRREGITSFDMPVDTKIPHVRQFSPVFSPGRELIAYFETGEEGIHLFMGNIDSEKNDPVECLTCGLDQYKYRNVIIDGRPLHGNGLDGRLVYLSRHEQDTYAIILDPIVGGMTDRIKLQQDQPTSAALSPDGHKLAYAAWQDGQSDIYVLNLNDLTSQRITNDPYVDETPNWSPDNEWIVYSSERENQFDLFQAPVSGGEPEAVVLSPGNETVPAWSPDGKWLVYMSDRIDGVLDPYLMNTETGSIRRLAAPVTGMFTPVFSADAQSIAAVLFFSGAQKIVVFPVDRELILPEVAKDAAVLGIEGEVETKDFPHFLPAGEVPADVTDLQNGKKKFRLIPDYAVGQISYGSDNDFYVEGGLVMSDILGDHQFYLIGLRRGNRNGILLSYQYKKHRIDYGVMGIQDSDYYYLYDLVDGNVYEVEWDYYGGQLHAEYPFTTFYRAEMDLGYFERHYETNLPGYRDYKEKRSFVQVAFSGDTAGFKPLSKYWEPYKGHRFRLAFRYPLEMGDDFEDFINTYFDYRAYLPLSKRILLAVREWGIISTGDTPERFGIGGYDTIRGYEYNTLSANSVAITNVELRFPLIDILHFPIGLTFSKVRGKVFADAGVLRLKGDDIEWKFDDPDTPEQEGNIVGAAGFGLNFWFIGVEWHFEWARKTDFNSFGGEWVYQWSIRRSF
jgi:Omp85 superfamily domain/Peptidase MA superfamily/WD40-like Beta Propeller Repeat